MHARVPFFVKGKVYGCFDRENDSKKNSQEIKGFVMKPLKYNID